MGLEKIYKIDGLYPDPQSVLEELNSYSGEEKQKFITELKEAGLNSNPNINAHILEYEYRKNMSE